MLAAGKAGDVRVAWMDNRTGWWNAWYRETADAGRTWSAEVRLSSATKGAPWQSSTGFKIRTTHTSTPPQCLSAFVGRIHLCLTQRSLYLAQSAGIIHLAHR